MSQQDKPQSYPQFKPQQLIVDFIADLIDGFFIQQ